MRGFLKALFDSRQVRFNRNPIVHVLKSLIHIVQKINHLTSFSKIQLMLKSKCVHFGLLPIKFQGHFWKSELKCQDLCQARKPTKSNRTDTRSLKLEISWETLLLIISCLNFKGYETFFQLLVKIFKLRKTF